MKFKPRLPLSTDSYQPGVDSPSTRPDEPALDAQAGPEDKSEAEALTGAFEAVAQVVRREMDSHKRAIVGLESQLVRRIETEKESLASAISSLRQDMLSRVEDLRQVQQKALADMSEQSKASIVSLRGQFEQARQYANTRADEIKAGLDQILTAREQKLEKELDAMTHSLSGMRGDLERQMSTASRVSALLNDIGAVFSDPRALPKEPPSPSR